MTFATETLGQHLNFANGKTSPERTERGKYAVFGSNGEIGRSNEKNSPAQTTVIGRVGSYCGSVHYSPEPCWVTDNAIKATAKTPEEGRFWFFALANQNLHDLRAGSGQPLINQTSLKAVELPVPGANSRQTIGALLGALDDKIELNRQMNETLEEMARALFRDWFVDFGPTRRQAEGATDPAAIMGRAFPPEKAASLAPLFPAKLGDDGLPEGWRHGTASDHIDFNPKEPLKKGTSAPYSDMASLPTSGSLIASPVARDFKSGMRFRNGDALIARITPCLENGKAGFVDYLTEEAPVGWGSTEFFVLRSKPHVAPQFAYCLVRDPDFRKRAEQSMTGTSGRQRAQIEVLKSHELAVPDESVHGEFRAITTPFFEKIKANGEENQTLAEMRDLLLPKLMSGEIRLKDAEAAV
ncbi:MAG: restriction endonuclease subunit S [Donghicola eburneus]|nr:restriction endonuclease subunit S [Donghicola eburneus]MCI5041624.1 restriction endonuclease subunit S [Donghicola eburneus]